MYKSTLQKLWKVSVCAFKDGFHIFGFFIPYAWAHLNHAACLQVLATRKGLNFPVWHSRGHFSVSDWGFFEEKSIYSSFKKNCCSKLQPNSLLSSNFVQDWSQVENKLWGIYYYINIVLLLERIHYFILYTTSSFAKKSRSTLTAN